MRQIYRSKSFNKKEGSTMKFRFGLWVVLILTAMVMIACGGGQQAGTNLAGTSWTLTSLGGAAPLPDTVITLIFGEDGTLSGSSGCNTFSTPYKTYDNSISISDKATMTMMACPDPVMEQERDFLFAAGTAKTFEVNGDELIFKDADGNQLTTFKKQ
jgi:heat shock protein HslJ